MISGCKSLDVLLYRLIRIDRCLGQSIPVVPNLRQVVQRLFLDLLCINRLIDCVPCHLYRLRRPSAELICIVLAISLRRICGFYNVRHSRSIVVRCCFLQDCCSVFIHKGHCVLVDCAVVRCSIGRIAGYFCNRRTPSCKGVGVLVCRCLRRIRRLLNICRRCSVVVRCCFLQDCCSVFIHKGHCVLVDCTVFFRRSYLTADFFLCNEVNSIRCTKAVCCMRVCL